MDVGERTSEFREWLNTGAGKLAAGGLCGVLIVTALGVFLFRPSDGRATADEFLERGRMYRYICRDCGATGELRASYSEQFPVECPQCGQEAAVKAFECLGCGRTIADPGKAVFRCPHCQRLYDNRSGR
jgi:putative FmdB family regulatory protein